MKSQRGLSIIELMVGMAIGLFAALAIVQSFASSEAARRATTGQADAQQVGTLASWRLMRELRVAGNGFASGQNVWGCRLRVWKNNATLLPRAGAWPAPFTAMSNTIRLIPVSVLDGGGNAPDAILVASGDSGTGGAPMTASVVSPLAISTAPSVGYAPGDLLMMSDPATPGGDCQIGQVDTSYTPPSSGQIATTTVPTSQLLAAPFNHLLGFSILPQPVDYTVTNLGSAPQFDMFGISSNNQLMQLDLLGLVTGGTPAPIAENVMNLQVLYGVDDGSGGGIANDNVIDNWVTPTGAYAFAALHANGETALAIKAIRIAMVVRSNEAQTAQSPATLTLFPDLPASLQVSISLSGAERSYQYQIYDSVIPLPNQRIALCAEHRRYNAVPAAGACS